jgi:multiple sugar transport system permease protein
MYSWIKKNYHHYLMLLPFFLLFAVFFLYPILFGVRISFSKWDSIHDPVFLGLENYQKIVSSPNFKKGFTNLLKYVSITVPINIVVAFWLAVLVNSYKGFWTRFFRGAYFLPTLIPLFLAASIWRWLFAADVGFINNMLGWFGIEQIFWLTDPKVMIFSLIIVDVWISSGFNMLIILSGLKNIPQEFYDAAKVDGASKFQEIIYITIPQLEPVLFLVITYGFISALQVFDAPWIMTASSYVEYGGRMKALLFPVMDMMGIAFNNLRFGRAAAYGLILTIFIFLITLFQFVIRRRQST